MHFALYCLILFAMVLFVLMPDVIFSIKNPGMGRLNRYDEYQDYIFMEIVNNIELSVTSSGKLPPGIIPPSDGLYAQSDFTRQIKYLPIDKFGYKICAKFDREVRDSESSKNFRIEKGRVYHPKGDYCYEVDLSSIILNLTKTNRSKYEMHKKIGVPVEISGKKGYAVVFDNNKQVWTPLSDKLSKFLNNDLPDGFNLSLNSKNEDMFVFLYIFDIPNVISSVGAVVDECSENGCGVLEVSFDYEDNSLENRELDLHLGINTLSQPKIGEKVLGIIFTYTNDSKIYPGNKLPSGVIKKLVFE